MPKTTGLDRLHARVVDFAPARWLMILTRLLLAVGFAPSGLRKVMGERFTLLGPEVPLGFLFEALYQSGFYYRFIGLAQVLAALLLLSPRTATLGAVIYFPIILNIFVITVSLNFRGTPLVTGLMLLGSVFLLCWDYPRLRSVFSRNGESAN